LTKSPDEIDRLKAALPGMSPDKQKLVLDELATRLIIPYILMALVLAGLGLLIRRSSLPDIKEDDSIPAMPLSNTGIGQRSALKTSIFEFPQLLLAVLAIFFGVSAEVLTVDSIINYSEYLGYSFMEAKYFATYTLMIMIVSYLAGIWTIPRYIRQKKVLLYAGMLGLVLTLAAISASGRSSVWFIASLGLCNALLWPSTWPLALEGLGKFTKQGSALLIMGVVGAAVTPLVYGMLSDRFNPQAAYWVLVPCYAFVLLFAAQAKPSSVWRRKAIHNERE
jgi:fucose permease